VWQGEEPPKGLALSVVESQVMTWTGFGFEQLYTVLTCSETEFINRPVWDYRGS
jgi:hypothetical protein